MAATLRIALGQCSEAGAKPVNQDFHGALLPGDSQVASKGFAAAVADAGRADVVILGTYRWLGAFQDGMVRLAEALDATGTPLVVVPLGNPDDLRFLPLRPDAYLAVYGYREANLLGAAAVLTGAAEPRGTLPVPAGEYPMGAGQSGF